MYKETKEKIMSCEENGILTSKDITRLGIHRSALQELVESGEYYRAARGIYVKSDEWEDDFAVLQKRLPKGIYSHSTALYLHGMSDRTPFAYHMTFPKGYNTPALKELNIIVTRVIPENYSLGITEVKSPAGSNVKVYDIERCLCDIVRGKGDDIQIVHSAMRSYAASGSKDINKLMSYAAKLRVEPKIRRYMEVLL